MKKPRLSFGQIWNLSFGFLGVQIGYSLQNSNTSSIFESLGADVSHLSYFWLAAPLAGMIIQPIVGMFSDGTWTRFGRRIPYILGGALVSTVALLLMPNCPVLLAIAPLALGAFILLFMDLSFNVTMQPFRALVADMLDDSQKTQGYVVQTFLINLGAVIGAFLPLMMTWFGVPDEAAPGQVSRHIAYSYYAGGIILLLFMNSSAAEALAEGRRFLLIISPFYVVVTVKIITDAVLRGSGDMMPFMVSTFSDLILRAALAFILSSVFGPVGIWLSWPIGWAAGTLISYAFYRSGHWKRNKLI